MRTTEYVVEAVDEHGDIDGEYFPTMQAAIAYRATALANVQSVRIARVTNHWDRNDRDNLLSRDYDYITL